MGSSPIKAADRNMVEWGKPGSTAVVAAPEPQAQAQPADQVTIKSNGSFKESSKSVKRDALLYACLVGARALPIIGPLLALPVAAVAGVTAFGEFNEGRKTNDRHQMIDGLAHGGMAALLVGGSILSALTFLPGPIVAASLLTLGKVIYDHKTGTLDFVVKQGASLVGDAAKTLGIGSVSVVKSLFGTFTNKG